MFNIDAYTHTHRAYIEFTRDEDNLISKFIPSVYYALHMRFTNVNFINIYIYDIGIFLDIYRATA